MINLVFYSPLYLTADPTRNSLLICQLSLGIGPMESERVLLVQLFNSFPQEKWHNQTTGGGYVILFYQWERIKKCNVALLITMEIPRIISTQSNYQYSTRKISSPSKRLHKVQYLVKI